MFDRRRYRKTVVMIAILASASLAAMSAFAQQATTPSRGYVASAGAVVAPFAGARAAGGMDTSKLQLAVMATGGFADPDNDGQRSGDEPRCVRLAALCRDIANTRIDVVAARSLLPSTPNLSPAGIRISRRQVTVHYTFR